MRELGEASATEHLGLAPDVTAHADLLFACGAEMKRLFDIVPETKRAGYAVDSAALAPRSCWLPCAQGMQFWSRAVLAAAWPQLSTRSLSEPRRRSPGNALQPAAALCGSSAYPEPDPLSDLPVGRGLPHVARLQLRHGAARHPPAARPAEAGASRSGSTGRSVIWWRKKGTPTMGGVLILSALTLSTLLWTDLANPYVWSTLFVTLGYGALGFADDYLKVSKRNTKGLSGRLKLVWPGRHRPARLDLDHASYRRPLWAAASPSLTSKAC